MLVKGFDKEVERFMQFWQEKEKCIILITDTDGWNYMTVMYLETGVTEQDIPLCGTECNKYKFMSAIRAYFKS